MRVCWSVKGGVGTTVISAVVALQRSVTRHVRLVDLMGDLPATLGIAEPSDQGIGEWLANDAAEETLEHLAIPVNDQLDLLPRGSISTDAHSLTRLKQFAAFPSSREVVVDAGTNVSFVETLLPHTTTSWLVLRPCYLALRRAVSTKLRVDGVILVNEPGRALSKRDVASVLSAPIVAEVEVDPKLARVIDAGLLTSRLPSSMNPLQRAA
jgi:hypothetical protein